MRTSPLASGNSDVTQEVSAMTKNYATKLEQASISHIVIHAAMIYSMSDFLVKENFQGVNMDHSQYITSLKTYGLLLFEETFECNCDISMISSNYSIHL